MGGIPFSGFASGFLGAVADPSRVSEQRLFGTGGPRFMGGERPAIAYFANAAPNILEAYFEVEYDTGFRQTFRINKAASFTTDRTAQTLYPQGSAGSTPTLSAPGRVVDAWITGSYALQRGQFLAYLVLEDASTNFSEPLAFGYLYQSRPFLRMGTFVEAGPSGGAGAITRVTLASTAGGGTTGKVLGVVPSGAMWRWISALSRYTASATVGSRNVRYAFRDGSGNKFAQVADATLTAGQTLDVALAPNLTSEASTVLFGNVGREDASPDRPLPAAYDLFESDTANIDAADLVTLEAQVEEWVMPK